MWFRWKKALFLWIYLANPILFFAQTQSDSLKLVSVLEIDFPFNIKNVEIDTEGNLLTISQEPNKICKYYVTTQYDSSVCIGGKAGRMEGFLNATEIIAPNRQTVYVLDVATRKISLLNMNFQVVEELDFLSDTFRNANEEIDELIPISICANNLGELFILSYNDNKVYKLNKYGELTLSFGGQSYGDGSLITPNCIRIDAQNRVLVGDTLQQTIKVFDRFGGYEYTLQPKLPFVWKNFDITQEVVFCYNKENVAIISDNTQTYNSLRSMAGINIEKLKIFHKNLFIFSKNHLSLRQIE